MTSNHPAVLVHKEFAEIEDPEDAAQRVPTQEQLVPYLEQLPRNRKYRILEPEVTFEDRELYNEVWSEAEHIGLEVIWNPNHLDEYGKPSDGALFGSCQWIRNSKNEDALEIFNDCIEATSSPAYYVIPTE